MNFIYKFNILITGQNSHYTSRIFHVMKTYNSNHCKFLLNKISFFVLCKFLFISATGCKQKSYVKSTVNNISVDGLWRASECYPEAPGRNILQQTCYIIDRKIDGSFTCTEYVVDNDKKIFFVSEKNVPGRWKIEGSLFLQRYASDEFWRAFEIEKVNSSLILRVPDTENYIFEEKLSNLPIGYSNDYKEVTEVEFENR